MTLVTKLENLTRRKVSKEARKLWRLLPKLLNEPRSERRKQKRPKICFLRMLVT